MLAPFTMRAPLGLDGARAVQDSTPRHLGQPLSHLVPCLAPTDVPIHCWPNASSNSTTTNSTPSLVY